MWNWLGIISTTLFLALSPEVKKVSPNNYETILNEKVACSAVKTKNLQVSYCVFTPQNPSSQIVYFFPGVLHNEMAWLYQRKNFRLRKIWSGLPQEPIVISLSAGPFFVFEQSSSSAEMLAEVLPTIEKTLLIQPSERIFYGNSLGAFNAFELAFASQNSSLKVQKLILGCPMIPTENPFPGQWHDSVLNYFERWKFKDSATWQLSSPLALAQQNDLKNFPSTYLVGGKEDGFHFMEGAKKLSQVLEQKKVPQILEEIPGQHCVVDIDKVSNFIVRAP
jgi:hypothetical protein